jgi:hypothetical protein
LNKKSAKNKEPVNGMKLPTAPGDRLYSPFTLSTGNSLNRYSLFGSILDAERMAE